VQSRDSGQLYPTASPRRGALWATGRVPSGQVAAAAAGVRADFAHALPTYADELLAGGNDGQRIANVLLRSPNKFKIESKVLSAEQKSRVLSRVNTHWPKRWAQGNGVEAAVEVLEEEGFTILFNPRNYPIPDVTLPPTAKISRIQHGPDLIAVNPTTGKVVVVEAKGLLSGNRFKLGNGTLVRNMNLGSPGMYTEGSLEWLNSNSKRYLTRMRNSPDTLHHTAADKIQEALNGSSYEVMIVVAGPRTWGTEMDRAFEALDKQTSSVRMIRVDGP